MSTPRCLCCDTELSNIGYIDGGCINCVCGVWADALRLRDGRPEVVALRVAALRDWGAEHIAKVVIGVVPFTPAAGES